MLSAVDWAEVRALRADGVSEREIARRLQINRRTVSRLAGSVEPPRYRRATTGSQLDSFRPLILQILSEWPEIKGPRLHELLRDEYGYTGSLRLLQEHLRYLRQPRVRVAQRTGYRPGQVAQIDWAEMPTRPRLLGRERRVYALVLSLPYSGAQTAFFTLEMTIEAFLEGHSRAFSWLGGVPRECVYDNLRSAVCRRQRGKVLWNERFQHLRGHYGFYSTACTPETPREKGSVEGAVRYLKSGFWPARRFSSLEELDRAYDNWRDKRANARLHATRRFLVSERLAEERQALRALPPVSFDWSGCRTTRVPIDCYLRHQGSFYRAPEHLVHERVQLSFDRDTVRISHRGQEVARYRRSYEEGLWFPPPRLRSEPPLPRPALDLPAIVVPSPELSPYAELCR